MNELELSTSQADCLLTFFRTLFVFRARAIIAQYFPREKLQFVLVGKAEEIRDRVRKYGEISEKEITGAGF